MMDIVIISNFCMDFLESDNGRFHYIAKELCSMHDVELITSNFYHITKQHRNTKPDVPYKLTLITEPGYPKNVSFKRFYSHYLWGINVYNYLKKRNKPDVIYCAVPSLTGPYLVSKYCKDNSIRFVIDVQDLWPEAFKMIVNIPLISQFVFIPFYLMSNGVYKRADTICAVSDTYCKRALSVNSKTKYSFPVYLGTDLDIFDLYASQKPLFQKRLDDVWLGYCGTLGSSYDLTCVIDALAYLCEAGEKAPFFLIMGDGPRQNEFEEYARKKKIDCKFTGRLSYDQMCALLFECDIVVNPIVESSVASIINKHADYAAAGRPVVNTQNSHEYRTLVDSYKMGFNCEPGDSTRMAECLKLLMENKELRLNMGQNARRCAEDLFDRKNTYNALVKAITEGE